MALTKRNSITAFFPCYNDKNTIGVLITDVEKILKRIAHDYEIIIIDDGSTDGSREVLKKRASRNKKVKLVFHEKNRGYGGALKSGFEAASKELVFYTDGDGQYDVKELEILNLMMSDDVSFVQGIKMDRQDYAYRVVMGNFYAFAMRWLFFLRTYDVDCDFRLIRKSVVRKINLSCVSGAVCVELVKKAQNVKAKFRHVGIHHYPRKYGQSQFFRLDRLMKTAYEISILWFRLMILRRYGG